MKKIRTIKNKPIAPPEIPDTTGVETTSASTPPVSKKDELINVLIDFSPVNEKYFSFRFSFKENKFVVTLNPAGEESYQEFIKWLKDGGFEEIPLDEFIIENRTSS